MTPFLVVLVLALVVIAGAAVVGPRLGVASPLVLVGIGVAASFLPVVGPIEIEPEWILAGVLPPLLYSSAVSMPAMNFRREFGAISGLSVLLVVGTSLVLGLFFQLVLPDLGFAWGVALGAIVSPTDAVATSIVKGTSVSRRVVAMLDGESLLNDATALVLLRTAIAAAAASFSFWGALGSFGYSVLIAAVVGGLVGWLNLAVRRRVQDPTVNTILSFTVPFLASVPAELLGASGLVAAVVAGVVTGIRAPRELSPQNRLSDSQNWRTVELVLEGTVFLTMGLQVRAIVTSVEEDHAGVGPAVLIAAGALLLTILVRAAYVAPLLGVLRSRGRLRERMRPRVEGLQEQMGTEEGREESLKRISRGRRSPTARDLERFGTRLTRMLADMEYFVRAPLGWREGTAVVWAGMRGAVTVAAAQTLPEDTPQRSVLVLIAFAVAALSLLLQGGTVGPLLRAIAPDVDEAAEAVAREEERTRVFALLRTSAEAVQEPPPAPDAPRTEAFLQAQRHRLAVIAAQRADLLDARDNGTFDADVLASVLAALDASQIDLEIRARTAR
ncbi:sodium:proton antiporter [Rathayibacter sp. VKM Ac-2926]|uniref:cation:proton antiporter n=1 Tax=Rathayibacter sp. VKM Ac-2926 TaxID=2929477 RepID=UPI001FB2C344|nr:sodium:proton antiporter [Rathayibacter sp. VKM Ac-2926]MCJ1702348.1 sodium:proton antiporter [Rathayibacter sp. VKM Ac-2926]